MDDLEVVFAQQRTHLRAVAVRIVGPSEADDAVQDAWLRADRAGLDGVDNVRGWLTTIVARVCLTRLQARRPTQPLDGPLPAADDDPEGDAVLADAVGDALLVVLDTLAPAERLAFVLHDLFAVPYAEVAVVLQKTPVAARQLASRARRRVQGASAAPDRSRERVVVEAFLAASRDGDFARLLEVLDPDVVLRADAVAVSAAASNRAAGAPAFAPDVRGVDAVAAVFSGRATAAQLALVDGVVGAVYAPGGTVRAVFDLLVRHGRIVSIEVVADLTLLAHIEVVVR